MPIKWKKTWISNETFESAAVIDVNNDGVPDIVSGKFWYQGPDFKKKFIIGEVKQYDEYYDDFSTIAMDINGDGRMDFVTGGWWGNTLRWRENPEEVGKQWKEHILAEVGNVETTRAWDIDGDGVLEILPNTPGAKNVKIYKLIVDEKNKGTGKFHEFIIYEFAEGKKQGHGLGCGDIAGNGRMDIVLLNGWLEAPKDPFNEKWIYHEEFAFGFWGASIPMLIVDVNGDGLNDIIVGNGHGYGLFWFEQKIENGVRKWIKHHIDPYNAQYHDMKWVDIDGDGQCELVTGKRHRAHCGKDPGEWDDYGLYYFKWNGESFSKQIIEYGPIGETKGTGIFFDVADMRGTGRLDIIAPGKDGLYIFYNEGN
jgi:hypothetical protein